MNELQTYRILIVEDNFVRHSEVMRMQLNRLESALKSRHIAVMRAYSYKDAMPLVVNDMDLDSVLLASESDKFSIHDVIEEFGIELLDDYFARSLADQATRIED